MCDTIFQKTIECIVCLSRSVCLCLWVALAFVCIYPTLVSSQQGDILSRFDIDGLAFKCDGCERVSEEVCRLDKELIACGELFSILPESARSTREYPNTSELISFLEAGSSGSTISLEYVVEALFSNDQGRKAIADGITKLPDSSKLALLKFVRSGNEYTATKELWKLIASGWEVDSFPIRLAIACGAKETDLVNVVGNSLERRAKLVEKELSGVLLWMSDQCPELKASVGKAAKFLQACQSDVWAEECNVSYFFPVVDASTKFLEELQTELFLGRAPQLADFDRLRLFSRLNYRESRTPALHRAIETSIMRIESSSIQTMMLKEERLVWKMLQFFSEKDFVIKDLVVGSQKQKKDYSKVLVFFLILGSVLALLGKRFIFGDSSFSFSSRTKNDGEEICQLLKYFGVERNVDQETLHSVYRAKAKKFHPDNSSTGDSEEFERLYQRHKRLKELLY